MNIKYISEGVKILDDPAKGLIMLLRPDCSEETIQRALKTTGYELLSRAPQGKNGSQYLPLRRKNDAVQEGSTISSRGDKGTGSS